MLKKILSVLLALVLALSVAACNQGDEPDTATTQATTEPTEDVEIPEETEDIDDLLGIEEDTLPIVLLLPGSIIPKQELPTYDWDAFAVENGFIAAELTEDGDISVTLTEYRQAEILYQLSVDMDHLIAAYVQGEATPYIQEILYGENYSIFTIKVDSSDYKASFDFASTALGQKALEYQLYTGNEYTVAVSITDAVSGNVIHDFKYPEA